MTLKIGNVFAKPRFEFKKKNDPCTEDATCLTVLKDSDSIIFTGKLTANITEYKATLNDNSIFTFIFGTNALPPVPTVKPQTETPTTSAIVTEQPETQPEPPTENPNESDTSTPASNGNDNSVNEHEPTPTTSSGSVGLASTSTVLVVIITQFLAQ